MKPIRVIKGSDGIYYCRPYLGTNAVTGKPIRPYRRFPAAQNEAEALSMAVDWVSSLAEAVELRVNRRLGELLERYIDMLNAKNVSPNTIKTYRSSVKCYVWPYIGDKDPDQISPLTIEGLYATLQLSGCLRGVGGISARTVAKLHWMLCGAYKWFMKKRLCATNPMLSVSKPSPDITEAVAYNKEDYERIQGALLKIIRQCPASREGIYLRNVAMAAHISLNTGARVGEVCALWRNEILETTSFKYIHIVANAVEAPGEGCYRRNKTKGKKMRNVTIDDQLICDLRSHFEWQQSYISHPTGHSFVCTNPDGRIMRPSQVSTAFSNLAVNLGLPADTSFHTLRHTHATWLLIKGMDMRTIQERLGHADVATTLRIYSHVMPGRDSEAAAAAKGLREGIPYE